MRPDFGSLRTRFIMATMVSVIIGTILTGLVVARVIQSIESSDRASGSRCVSNAAFR